MGVEDSKMNEYTAIMIARSEHKLRQQSRPPVIDFDMRGQGPEPRWVSKQIGKLFQFIGSLMVSVGERMNREPDVTCKIPLSDADQLCQ
jgi:hypothetical protein